MKDGPYLGPGLHLFLSRSQKKKSTKQLKLESLMIVFVYMNFTNTVESIN